MTGRAICESRLHQTKTSAPLLLPFTLRGAERIVSIHVRHVGAQLSQTNDKALGLLRRKARQQPLFARKRRDDDAVMKRIAGFGQAHDSRTVVVGVGFACHKPLLLKYMQASADRAFIKSDRIDDLVGADIRHASEYAHYAPFGDAKSEMLPVGVGCAARQSVRNVGEKIWNMTIEIERDSVGCCCGLLTNVFLLHKNAPQLLDGKFGHSQKDRHTK